MLIGQIPLDVPLNTLEDIEDKPGVAARISLLKQRAQMQSQGIAIPEHIERAILAPRAQPETAPVPRSQSPAGDPNGVETPFVELIPPPEVLTATTAAFNYDSDWGRLWYLTSGPGTGRQWPGSSA